MFGMAVRSELVTFDTAVFDEVVFRRKTLSEKQRLNKIRRWHLSSMMSAAKALNASALTRLRADLLDDDERVLSAYRPGEIARFLVAGSVAVAPGDCADRFGMTDPEAYLARFPSRTGDFVALALYGETPAPRMHLFWHGWADDEAGRLGDLGLPGRGPREIARRLDPPLCL